MRQLNDHRISVVVVAALVLLLVPHGGRAEDKANPKAKMRELLQERLAASKKIHDLTIKGYAQGELKVTIDKVKEAKAKLLETQLILVATKEQRIRVLEAAVKDALEWEELAVKRSKVAGSSEVDPLTARLYRLELESTLTALELDRAEKFQAIVVSINGDRISFLRLKTDGAGSVRGELVVPADCQFVQATRDQDREIEVEGPLAGGREAFVKRVKEIMEADKKGPEPGNARRGLRGVLCHIVTAGENPTRIMEIGVVSAPKKKAAK